MHVSMMCVVSLPVCIGGLGYLSACHLTYFTWYDHHVIFYKKLRVEIFLKLTQMSCSAIVLLLGVIPHYLLLLISLCQRCV